MTKATVMLDRLKRYMKGGAHIGGATNYTAIGTDGAITQGGTQSNTFSGTTTISGTATFSAAPVLSGSGRTTRTAWVPWTAFSKNSSATSAALNSRWNSVLFSPATSATDVTIYAQWPVPADLDTTYGITPVVWWSRGANGTSSAVADWEVDVECVDSGEASGTASTADITAGASYTGASANIIWESTLDTVGANVIAADDLVSLELRLEGTDGLTTAGCPYFLGLALKYKASSV